MRTGKLLKCFDVSQQQWRKQISLSITRNILTAWLVRKLSDTVSFFKSVPLTINHSLLWWHGSNKRCCFKAQHLMISEIYAIWRLLFVTDEFQHLYALKVYPVSFHLFKKKNKTVLLLCYRFHKSETALLGMTHSDPVVFPREQLSNCVIILMTHVNR